MPERLPHREGLIKTEKVKIGTFHCQKDCGTYQDAYITVAHLFGQIIPFSGIKKGAALVMYKYLAEPGGAEKAQRCKHDWLFVTIK